jgi:hypothetical protein
MDGFIGIRQGDKHLLLNINQIVSIEGTVEGNGTTICYAAGSEARSITFPDVNIYDLLNGMSHAASAIARGSAMPASAAAKRAAKGELDS